MKKTFLLLISVCLACASSFAADRSWDFTNWSQATLDNIAADATNWANSSGSYTYQPAISSADLKANSVVVAELDGLQFTGSAKRFMIDNRASSRSFRLTNTNAFIHIPNCEVGDVIYVTTKTASSSSARGLVASSDEVTRTKGEATSTELNEQEYEVISAGTVSFSATGGLQIYTISVGAVVLDDPTISLQSGLNDQTVYPTQNIKDIVYKWGGTATGTSITWTGTANATTAPDGITITSDASTTTITGAPTSTTAATYTYSITATDGTKTSEALTGTIAVKVTNKYKLAYITTITGGNPDERDTKILDGVEAKFDINYISAAEVDVDFSIYDVVAVSAVPNSSTPGIVAGQTAHAAALNKPFVQMKSFVVNSSRWNWIGDAANTLVKEIEITNDGKAHKLFNGVTIDENNLVSLADGSYSGNAVVTFSGWAAHVTPAPITLAKEAGSGLGSYAEIPTGTQIGTNASDVTEHPIILLGLSESSWNNLTADAKTIVANALRYVVNDTFSVGVTDKNIDNSNKAIDYKEYYDMMGKKLSAKPLNAIAIEKVVYEDGSIEYLKVRYTK